MSFLQPILLAALPLVALPVIIHLINQRRYQTVRWAAMMFLLAANRMSRGYAKLRQWLILLFRTLAIAALIFAVSRPLASGWLGLTAGGRPDTTIILLDRSPSMRQQGAGTIVSKLDAGRQQLASTLNMLGSGRWVLIESTSNTARDIESPDVLLKSSSTEPASTSADLPAMLEAARDYVRANKSGRTEIWICSDIRQNDWNAESGRWRTLRDSFLEFPQAIRFHLLAYSDIARGNLGVQVTNVRRHETTDSTELLVSLKLMREGAAAVSPPREQPASADGNALAYRASVPIQFEIDGARSELTIEMDGPTFELKDHRIPIERARERGWVKVSIPADTNPADNDFYFVFDQPRERQTIVVSDDAQAAGPLQLAAAISPDPSVGCSAEIITLEQLATTDWENISLLLWHARLPEDDAAQAVRAFVERGGQVVFLPPREPADTEFMGIRWQSWSDEPSDIPIETWRGDQDILANAQSGAALPVGQLRIGRYCGLTGELTNLASLKGGKPLLARLPTNRGGVYFCATTPASGDSSLATNGVVLYVFIHRALAAGAAVLGQTQQLVAGAATQQTTTWKQVAGPPEAISTDYAHHAGIYTADEKLLAINREASEDQSNVLADDQIAGLFEGLDFTRVDDQAGSLAGLIQEVWRLFLVSMLVALLVEAALCMPRLRPQAVSSGFAQPEEQTSRDSQNGNGESQEVETLATEGVE